MARYSAALRLRTGIGLAIVAAGIALLIARPGIALAHHVTITEQGDCGGWETKAEYFGGPEDRKVVVDVVINGEVISQTYLFDATHLGHVDYYLLYDRTGTGPLLTSGSITMYSKVNGQYTYIADQDSPTLTFNCGGPTATRTATATATATEGVQGTVTPVATATSTPITTDTPSATETPSGNDTPTATPGGNDTPTATPGSNDTPTATPDNSETPTATLTVNETPTATATLTSTLTPIATTPTSTVEAEGSVTPIPTGTVTRRTATPTRTATPLAGSPTRPATIATRLAQLDDLVAQQRRLLELEVLRGRLHLLLQLDDHARQLVLRQVPSTS